MRRKLVMPRTRVGIFTPDFFPIFGGMGRLAVDLYHALLDDPEFEPVVFSTTVNDLSNHQTIRSIDSRTLGPVHFSVQINVRLDRLVRKYRLDLLHFMGSSGGAQLLRRAPRPALVTLHNTYYYLNRQFGGPVFRVLLELERRSLRYADKVTTVSQGVRAELPPPVAVNARVVTNGIDLSLFQARDVARERVFLYVGRLAPRKGVLDLVTAFGAAGLDGYQLELAGEGPMASEIEACAARLGVRDRVRLLGHVDHARLPELYSRAHAVVLPSWGEGFPLTVAEAMACGALFIGTRIPGVLEQVEDGVNGLLCPPRDPVALARRLIEAASLPAEQIAAMRRRAAESARERSTAAMVHRYREVYRCLLH